MLDPQASTEGQRPREIIPSRRGWRRRFDTVARQQMHEEQARSLKSHLVTWIVLWQVWAVRLVRLIHPASSLALGILSLRHCPRRARDKKHWQMQMQMQDARCGGTR